jgi:hypothetical protein
MQYPKGIGRQLFVPGHACFPRLENELNSSVIGMTRSCTLYCLFHGLRLLLVLYEFDGREAVDAGKAHRGRSGIADWSDQKCAGKSKRS